MTHAQVELAINDRPVTDYRTKRNEKGSGSPKKKAVEDANKRSIERLNNGGNNGGKIDTSMFFNKK